VQSLLTPRLPVSFAVAISLLLPFQVCQPGTGLGVLLAVAVPLLVLSYGQHAVSSRQHVP
jgi:hypothetical protein